MSHAQCRGAPAKFRVRDSACLGRDCFQPGHYQHRGGTLSGSRNTGASSPCCLRNAYHGCPDDCRSQYDEGAWRRQAIPGPGRTRFRLVRTLDGAEEIYQDGGKPVVFRSFTAVNRKAAELNDPHFSEERLKERKAEGWRSG